MATKKVPTNKIKTPRHFDEEQPQKAYSLEDIRLLAKTLTQYDLSELEVEYGGERVRLCRETGRVGTPAMPMFSAPPFMPQPYSPSLAPAAPTFAPPPAAVAPAPAAPSTAKEKKEEKSVDEDLQVINSPFVGTFYRAPSPESSPFIEAGQKVRKGQVLCIVEAMKLMNEIEAEAECQIVEILVQNAQPVEFGQALFKVRLPK